MSALLLVGCSSGGKSPDNALPVITLTGDNPQIIAVGEAYVELGATASDNRDGDLTTSIVVNASAIDSAVPGTYQVSYNVSDAAGNAATTVTRTVTVELTVPEEPTVSVTGDIKTLNFSWSEPEYVDYYRLMENPDGHSGFTQAGDDIPAGTLSVPKHIAVHLHDWENALYKVQACNSAGCTGSTEIGVAGLMLDTIGLLEGSNTEPGDIFGEAVALSADGNTLAVGAVWEDSGATGIHGDQSDNSAENSGAVYVLVRSTAGNWSQQAYIKASNTGGCDCPSEDDWPEGDVFGRVVALSADGNTLAVGAPLEDSDATGVNGDQENNNAPSAGAVYVFVRDANGEWSQQAYIKASNSEQADFFGSSIALSGDTLAVGAYRESSAATGVNGDQADNTRKFAGAVYVFTRDLTGAWSQEAYIKSSDGPGYGLPELFGWSVALSGNTLAVGARWSSHLPNYSAPSAGAVYVFKRDSAGLWSEPAYIKASNTDRGDSFGNSVALSGEWLVVGAPFESSNATGINGNQDDNSAQSGAVYVFRFDGMGWNQQAYIKASNTGELDGFGWTVALSENGSGLVVGAPWEDSIAKGINGDQSDNNAENSGAIYVFRFDDTDWVQQAYVKSSIDDHFFGGAFALSADGKSLAVGHFAVYVY
jgi:hypothetical protein